MGKIFSNPNQFQIGDLILDVPPEDISWGRYENHQTLDWLRSEGSMKIPSGRAAIRLDVRARFSIGEGHQDLEKLKALVAMTRTAPFVPVRNQFIFDHLPLLGREGQNVAASEFSGDSIPCAIQGLSVMVGGDSPELIEARFTLMYWNPAPFMGLEALTWAARADSAILGEYSRYYGYIDKVLNDAERPVNVPSSPKETRIRWYNLASYNELKERFGIRRPRLLGKTADELVVEGWRGWGSDAVFKDDYYTYAPQQELAERIAAVERRTTPADSLNDLRSSQGGDTAVRTLITRYYDSAGFDTGGLFSSNQAPALRKKALKEWDTGRDISDVGCKVYVSKVLDIPLNRVREATERIERPKPESASLAVDPKTRSNDKPIPNVVDPEDLELFQKGTEQQEGGWRLVDPGEIQSLDPMFRQQGNPEVIDLTPAGLRQTDNQIVTGLTVTFQNKFSLMPMQGYPYPALQHLGNRDSEVVLSVACMSPIETYPSVKGVMQMLHDMSQRTIKFRGKLYSGRQIHAISEMRLENKVLNRLGLANFIMTSVDVGRDEESPELVRMTLTLTENNVTDEEFRGHLNYSDRSHDMALFEFLTSGRWEEELEGVPGLKPRLLTLKGLWDLAHAAHTSNARAIEDGEQVQVGIESLVVPSQVRTTGRDFQAPIVEGYWTRPTTDDGTVLLRGKKHVPLKSSWPLPEFQGIEEALSNVFHQVQAGKLVDIPVVIEGDKIIGKNLSNAILEMMGWWVNNADEVPVTKYTSEQVMNYLSTNAGQRFKNAANNLGAANKRFDANSLNPSEDDKALVREASKEYLRAWNDAQFEWYRDFHIKRALKILATRYPDVFESVNLEFQQRSGSKPGTYRDLFLGDPQYLNTDPYAWLDAVALGNLKDSVAGFANGVESFATDVKKFASREALGQEDPDNPTSIYIDKRARYGDQDNPNVTKNLPELVEDCKAGTQRYFQKSVLFNTNTADEILSGIRTISPTQFTVRRCFPTFKLFFVEEDNRGVLKSFDEFYNYNAVINWTLHEHTNRPATLTIVLTNLFNHLDNIILGETIKGDQRDQLMRASRNSGYLPIQHYEINGQNVEHRGDVKRDIQNIMLKPGAPIVLKAGYSNNPDNLTTIFSGQVTEVMPGDVMHIVCQDWGSELLVPWDPDYGQSQVDEVGWIEAIATDNEVDITGTKGTYLMLWDILHQLSSRHLGAWKIGEPNPFVIYNNTWVQQRVAKRLTGGGYSAGGWHMTNIKPAQMPFYSAAGIQDSIQDVPYKGRLNWEIIQELRLRHCNNVTFVRPFGGANGTLYFGPPWGRYTTSDDTVARDPRYLGMLQSRQLEAFQRIVRESIEININDVDYNPTARKISRNGDRNFLGRWLVGAANAVNPNVGRGRGRAPIYAILGDWQFTRELFKSTGEEDKYRARLEKEIGNRFENEWSASGAILNPSSTDEVIQVYFDAITAAGIGSRQGRIGASDSVTDILRFTKQKIRDLLLADVIQNTNDAIQTANEDGDEEALDDLNLNESFLEYITTVTRPVRRWHVATSKHHIVANNMTVNANFYNALAIPGEDEVFVQYDPGLDDRRIRYAKELADIKNPAKTFMAASMLRDEMRKMYRGEIILTGNPEIRAHDILVISDDVRQIFGIVEVDKVVHSMDGHNGFITIVTPALVCEVGDMTLTHAYQAFYSQLASDLEKLQESGALGNVLAKLQAIRFRPFNLGNVEKTINDAESAAMAPGEQNLGLQSATVGTGIGMAGASAIGAGVGGTLAAGSSAIAGTSTLVAAAGAATLPLALILGGGLLLGAGIAYFGLQNATLKKYVRNHPISITPVSKRGWPWLAGIDGADGRTMVGQWGLSAVKGWDKVNETLNVMKRAQVLAGNTISLADDIKDLYG